jgi:hypothetical protein
MHVLLTGMECDNHQKAAGINRCGSFQEAVCKQDFEITLTIASCLYWENPLNYRQK